MKNRAFRSAPGPGDGACGRPFLAPRRREVRPGPLPCDRATTASGASSNSIGQGQNAGGVLGMQALDHAPIQGDGALAGILREGFEDAPRLRNFFRRRGENAIADFDLAGMDQGLAVKAKSAALGAALQEARLIRDLVIRAVNNTQTMRPRGNNRLAQ